MSMARKRKWLKRLSTEESFNKWKYALVYQTAPAWVHQLLQADAASVAKLTAWLLKGLVRGGRI